MDNIKIEVIDCPSGDWTVLKFNGRVYEEGHSIPQHSWVDFLKYLGYQVETREISDKDMEEGIYG